MQKLTTQDLFQVHASTPAPEAQPEVKATTTANFRRTTAEATPSVKPASDKSVAFLRKLVAERKPDTDPAFVEQVISEGQARVSKAIDNLLAMPKPEAPIQDAPERTNRYEALCEDCRVMVPEGEGILIRSDEGRWEVYHRDGECQRTDFPFPYGRYAVEGEDGSLKFYAATVTGLYVQASDELHTLPANAVEGIVAKIAADPLAASQAYGREFTQCGRCGRGLTDEQSRAAGIGPVCRTRF